ncbi:MAG TPA: GGDEF domain-containing protein [Sandaracinaceae bacterium LLY-WYZ-13_1]|nr:GGDEF domain-containing protein [Sandaracinaceae bacterium LLY-WYZ-13_1]
MDSRLDQTVQTMQLDAPGVDGGAVVRDRCMLTMLSGPHPGAIHSVDGDVLVLGRDRSLPARIDDRGISRRHARVIRIAGVFYVEDLGSTNGTRVNGERVSQPRPLRDGDRIQLGASTLLRVTLQDEQEAEVARRLYESAVRDPLTGIFNRGHFDERLLAEFAYADRHRSALTVVLIDLDRFKQVNDTHGHQAGDAVLRDVAATIQRTIRAEDLLARYGGEELVLLVRGIDPVGSAHMAERVRATVEAAPVRWQGRTIPVTASLGVATMTAERPFEAAEHLLAAADRAVYAAKASGRNTVIVG